MFLGVSLSSSSSVACSKMYHYQKSLHFSLDITGYQYIFIISEDILIKKIVIKSNLRSSLQLDHCNYIQLQRLLQFWVQPAVPGSGVLGKHAELQEILHHHSSKECYLV